MISVPTEMDLNCETYDSSSSAIKQTEIVSKSCNRMKRILWLVTTELLGMVQYARRLHGKVKGNCIRKCIEVESLMNQIAAERAFERKKQFRR